MKRHAIRLALPAGRSALLAAALLLAGPAVADELLLPAPALDPTGPVVVLWRPDAPAAGELQLEWTEGEGRLLERHRITLAEPQAEIAIRLDLRRARTPANRITARFRPAGSGAETKAEARFFVRPASGWTQYQVILWQDLPAAALVGMRSLGITGSRLLRPLSPAGRDDAEQRMAVGLRWYTENLATDFYAPYHRWTPGRSVTWLFDQTKARHQQNPDDLTVFHRQPSLSDPAWLATIEARLTEIARVQAPYRPLFHNLADESGIADLAAAWDFDLSPASLEGMRVWLKERHGSLAALNRAWGTDFPTWEAVTPALTRDALRSEAAVPSWMEFKAWMDVAFARAVRAGTNAIHRGDPQASAALEGAQVPGWGGYDYGLLASAVDAMEIYDGGNAIEIARSLNPDLRVLITCFGTGAAEQHRLWRAWLLGAQGTIIWDEDGSVAGPDGQAGPRGALFAAMWREQTGALGVQLLEAQPAPGQVAILYSQASFRMNWLLDRRLGGDAWVERDSEAEGADNPWRAATRRAAQALAGLGAQPRWITPEALSAGELTRDGTRLLVLPHSIALSNEEVAAVRGFAEAGGLILADVPPGEHDALGRRRNAPPFADLVASRRLRLPASLQAEKVPPGEMVALLAEAGVHAPLALLDATGRPAADLDIRLFRSGGMMIAGIQRQDGAEGERQVELRLPGRLWVRSLRDGTPAALTDRLVMQLGPIEPVLLALSPASLPAPTLSGPALAARGDLVTFRLGLDGPASASAHVMRLEVVGPTGQVVSVASGTVRVTPEGTLWHLPLALDDMPGQWRVRATEVVSGQSVAMNLQVR
ncbi:beta-galactosidase [Reyranella soli]|uniref:beta-galactosidase n=1 Tax=Reyranella soli TaxID=1230389 RepID=UPI0014783417|nr:beta-galactosidase [Reyranella soli]